MTRTRRPVLVLCAELGWSFAQLRQTPASAVRKLLAAAEYVKNKDRNAD